MQDADGPPGVSGHQYRGLVCHHRSKGCLLLDLYLAGTLVVPQIQVRGADLQVPGPPPLASPWHSRPSPALAPMRLRGLRVLNYLDDCLVCALSATATVPQPLCSPGLPCSPMTHCQLVFSDASLVGWEQSLDWPNGHLVTTIC